jgi:hypothetical protein
MIPHGNVPVNDITAEIKRNRGKWSGDRGQRPVTEHMMVQPLKVEISLSRAEPLRLTPPLESVVQADD